MIYNTKKINLSISLVYTKFQVINQNTEDKSASLVATHWLQAELDILQFHTITRDFVFIAQGNE